MGTLLNNEEIVEVDISEYKGGGRMKPPGMGIIHESKETFSLF